MADLPDVPTVAEIGYMDFEVIEWNGFFFPAGTPQPVVDGLGAAVRAAVADPEC